MILLFFCVCVCLCVCVSLVFVSFSLPVAYDIQQQHVKMIRNDT